MKSRIIRRLGAVLPLLPFVIAACGGGSAQEPPAKTGESPAGSASAAVAKEAPSADGGAPSDDKAGAKETAEPAPPAKDVPKPSRPVKDVLTQKDTLFMLSFDESDAGKAAQASCAKASANDPKKVAACMTKERAKVEADGHGFKKDKEGNLTWVVVHRKGKILITDHKLRMTFVNETDNSIVVKPEGKDTGKKKGRTPGEFTVEVPSDYKIVISDPRFGKLVYEAKIGLVPDNLL